MQVATLTKSIGGTGVPLFLSLPEDIATMCVVGKVDLPIELSWAFRGDSLGLGRHGNINKYRFKVQHYANRFRRRISFGKLYSHFIAHWP